MVVEVVFAHDFGTVRLEHAGHRVAHGRPARAADVDRAGRVGGDEFKIERFAAQVLVLAEVRAVGEHLVHHGGGGRGGAADVDRAGRVGGDEFKIERFAAQVLVLAEVRAVGEHLVHHGGGGRGVKGDVDEAGACDFHARDAIGVVHERLECLGELARLHAGLLGELHGGVRRPVAVRAVLGAHHSELGWFGDLVGGQIAGFAACNKLLGNAVYQVT